MIYTPSRKGLKMTYGKIDFDNIITKLSAKAIQDYCKYTRKHKSSTKGNNDPENDLMDIMRLPETISRNCVKESVDTNEVIKRLEADLATSSEEIRAYIYAIMTCESMVDLCGSLKILDYSLPTHVAMEIQKMVSGIIHRIKNENTSEDSAPVVPDDNTPDRYSYEDSCGGDEGYTGATGLIARLSSKLYTDVIMWFNAMSKNPDKEISRYDDVYRDGGFEKIVSLMDVIQVVVEFCERDGIDVNRAFQAMEEWLTHHMTVLEWKYVYTILDSYSVPELAAVSYSLKHNAVFLDTFCAKNTFFVDDMCDVLYCLIITAYKQVKADYDLSV